MYRVEVMMPDTAIASTVEFQSAGSHKFHMGHLNRNGGPELIMKALQACGLNEPPRHWRVVVQKQLGASGDTPVLKVVGWERGFVDLKIKPGDVRSCHRVRLVMPSGVKAHDVFHKLTSVADQFDTHWQTSPVLRKEEILGCPTGRVVEEESATDIQFPHSVEDDLELLPVTTEEPESTSTSSPKGIVGDITRTRQVLLAIYGLQIRQFTTQAEFVEALGQELGWGDVSKQRSTIAGLFASMNRRGYIENVKYGSLPAGYKLTHSGLIFIRDLLPDWATVPDIEQESAQPGTTAVPSEASQPPAPKSVTITLPDMAIDPLHLIVELGPMAVRIAEVAARLKKNREERHEYQEVIDRLDAEAVEMLAPFQDKEQQLLMQMLVERGRHVTNQIPVTDAAIAGTKPSTNSSGNGVHPSSSPHQAEDKPCVDAG